MIATDDDVEIEADRLLRALMHVECDPRGRRWNYETCREIAPLTLEINRLKKEKDAVILAHSYVEPEIIYGVADFRGDSYFLSLKAKQAQAKMIVFAGVVFMAETAKILSPDATVVVPDRGSGCSLADSITGEDVKKLKALYPDATVVCYINSTAEVKAESDVCVTSGNVYHIVANLPARRILFVPDRLMAENVRSEMKRRGVERKSSRRTARASSTTSSRRPISRWLASATRGSRWSRTPSAPRRSPRRRTSSAAPAR